MEEHFFLIVEKNSFKNQGNQKKSGNLGHSFDEIHTLYILHCELKKTTREVEGCFRFKLL